jgi:hypothetical protein
MLRRCEISLLKAGLKYDDEKKWSKEVHRGAAVDWPTLGCELLLGPVFQPERAVVGMKWWD